ncbi:hypothetical protein POG22_21765 [Geitlerinema sp. CS-897]|nr:hypothetical protein [Geitlerinema sp. CS-897]
MACSQFQSIGSILKEFGISYTEEDFVIGVEFEIPVSFRDDLEFVMREGVVDNSEFAICENLIYPVLKEVWKRYAKDFVLWSHQALNYDDRLSGFPEYILAKRSELGKVVFDRPYLLLVEARQDKFEEGWSQCLAEMIAAQKLNDRDEVTIFGIVSNGKFWQFGKLEGDRFTKNIHPYTIYDLDRLFAAVNYSFQQCQFQLESYVSTL